MTGTFYIYRELNLLFILESPSVNLIRKLKYERGLRIIPAVE